VSIRSCLRPNWPLHVYHWRIFRWHLFFRWEAREEEEDGGAGRAGNDPNVREFLIIRLSSSSFRPLHRRLPWQTCIFWT